jgi:drug/metabolite transporter (DMT)-like permease
VLLRRSTTSSFSVAITAAYTNPLFLVLLSPWLLFERVGPARIAAVIIGFLGIALISRPEAGAFSWAILLPIGSALFGAFRDVWMRRLIRSDSSVSILLFSQLLLTFSGMPTTIFDGVSIGLHELGLLCLMALGMGLSIFCSIEAFRLAEASFVAPFRYSGMVWAPLFAYPIWNEVPTVNKSSACAWSGSAGCSL